MSEKSDAWLRRQAVQIVAQLPPNPDDALRVLEFAREFVRDFLMVVEPPADQEARVVPFPVVG